MSARDTIYENMSYLDRAEYHIDHCQYDLAGLLICIAQAQAEERQAAALDEICRRNNSIAEAVEAIYNPDGHHLQVCLGVSVEKSLERQAEALERIATALELVAGKRGIIGMRNVDVI